MSRSPLARLRESDNLLQNLFVVAVLVVLAGSFLVALLKGTDDSDAADSSSPQNEASASSTPSTPSTPTSPASTSESSSSPSAGSGEGSRATVSTVVDDTTLQVQERVTLADAGDSLQLTFPDRTGRLSVFAIQVDDIRVDTGSGEETVDQDLAPGGSIDIPLPEGTEEVTISYEAVGAVRLSDPSVDGATPGRALALVTPLQVEPDADDRSIEIVSDYVDNVACVSDAQRVVACGATNDDGWEADGMPGDFVDVFAQLTLPSSEISTSDDG